MAGPSDARASLTRAHEERKALRIARADGEEIVARLLAYDAETLTIAVHTSTHPERYAVCDSTGFELALAEVLEVEVLDNPPPRWRFVLE